MQTVSCQTLYILSQPSDTYIALLFHTATVADKRPSTLCTKEVSPRSTATLMEFRPHQDRCRVAACLLLWKVLFWDLRIFSNAHLHRVKFYQSLQLRGWRSCQLENARTMMRKPLVRLLVWVRENQRSKRKKETKKRLDTSIGLHCFRVYSTDISAQLSQAHYEVS